MMKTKRLLAALLALLLVMGTLPAALAIGGDPTIACNHPATKWVDVQTVPDCRSYGVQAQVCTTCGTWVGPTRDARGPHSWGAWAVTQEATCRQTGTQRRTCSLCNLAEEQTLPKGSHKAGAWTTVREATCTVKGLEESKCLVCGTKITRETALLPHSVQEWTVTAAPTCVKAGSRTGTCAVCGAAVTEKLEAAGHSWDEGKVVRKAKCESTGTMDATCTVCGTKQRVTLPATGHTWGEWTVTIEPDGANQGRREHRCTVCGKRVSEYFFAEGTLMEGDRGDEVAGLNAMLEDLGYNNEKDSDTFTRKTKAGVSTFQKAEGLKQSGVADPATRLLINMNWQIKWKVPELIEREWPSFFDVNRPGNRVLVDWRFTRPPHIRLTYGPWVCNGNGTHTRRNFTLATSETEKCELHEIPLSNDRTLFVCYLCGYKYVRIGRLIIPLEDGVQYISNGDGTHTVVDVAGNVIKQPKILTEDCRFVPIGDLDCNETGSYDVVCKDCGYQKRVGADGLTALGYPVAHQEPRATETRCSGDITFCVRCGYVYSKTTTGTACVYETTWYRTDAELAAFAQKHGDIGNYVCCAWEEGRCLNCCVVPPASRLSWGVEWHEYAPVGGQSVCVKCGRACPQHEAEAAKGTDSCSFCGVPFAAQAEECPEGRHSFSVLAYLHGGSQTPALAALAAQAGVYDYCYAELEQCTQCGKLRLSVIRDEHFWEYDDNRDRHCLACGKVEHTRLSKDGKGVPCTADGMVPLTCLRCGAEVLGYPDPTTLTHDFDDTVRQTCYATIRHCRRCGQDVQELTGELCDNLESVLSKPEELTAAGYDPAETCYVKLYGNCKVCGSPRIEGYNEESFGHDYQTVNGSEVCANCGRKQK